MFEGNLKKVDNHMNEETTHASAIAKNWHDLLL